MLHCNIFIVAFVVFTVTSLIVIYPCVVYGNEKQWLDSASETQCTVKGYEIKNKKYCLKKCWSGNVLFLIQPSKDTMVNKKMISGQETSRVVLKSLKKDYLIDLSYKCWYNQNKKELKLFLVKYNASIFGIVLCCVIFVASIIAMIYFGYKVCSNETFWVS